MYSKMNGGIIYVLLFFVVIFWEHSQNRLFFVVGCCRFEEQNKILTVACLKYMYK